MGLSDKEIELRLKEVQEYLDRVEFLYAIYEKHYLPEVSLPVPWEMEDEEDVPQVRKGEKKSKKGSKDKV